MTTVSGSGVSTRSIMAANTGPRGLTMPRGGCMMRAMVYWTSADENGMPSCHFTPLWRCLVEMKGQRLATVAEVPCLCQLGNDVQGHGVVRTGADEAVIGWSHRGINSTKG